MLHSNLEKRILTSIFALPIVIFPIYLGGLSFIALLVVATILMAFEWTQIITQDAGKIIKKNKNKGFWQCLGVVYISIPIVSLFMIRGLHHGLELTFWLLIIVWLTDIFAYIFGKSIGGKRLAPKTSPNKTWAGLFGGLLAVAIFAAFTSQIYGGYLLLFLATALSLSIISQLSDLLESKFKRLFKIKESGDIFPGHGGILDRTDGLILTAPIFYFYCVIFLLVVGVNEVN